MRRIRPNVPPKAPKAKTRPSTSKRPHRTLTVRRVVVIYSLLVLISAAVALAYVRTQAADAVVDPFSGNQRAAADFKLYYPAELPDDYGFELSSATVIPGTTVQTLNLTDRAGGNILISQQPEPAQFDFQSFHASFGDKTVIKTPLGEGMAGTIDGGGTRIGSLVTKDGTWIIITAKTDALADEDMERLLHSLKVSK